jgi:hypothetical protein
MPKKNNKGRSNGKHTSLSRKDNKFISGIRSTDSVKKVLLGTKKRCGHSHKVGTIKLIRNTRFGIKVNFFTDWGKMQLSIVISPIEQRDLVKVALFNEVSRKLKIA